VDVVTFLGRYPPFDSLESLPLARVAAAVQIEHFPAGAVILQQSGEPARFLYVVRKGAVEILDEGRVVDLMGEGEVFGAWSLLAGIGPTASVRAHQDVLCYLIEQELAEEVLGTAGGIAFVLASLQRRIVRIGETYEADRAADQYRPVGVLIRRPAVTCEPSTTVGDAAAMMVRDRVSSLLIPTPDGLGILTDRDLRSRVVAARRDSWTPVSDVMTFPATTVTEDAMAGEVLLRMLELGHHHFPVVDGSGILKGVITDTDLMGLGRHTPFALKSAIERSRDRDEAVAAARDFPQVVATLVDAHADPVGVGHIVGLAIDALTRRLLELGIVDLGDPPVPWAWLALGSAARQEQAIHTDQDHALAYEPQGMAKEDIDPYFAKLAEFVTAGLEAAGVPRCNGDAMAANAALRKSVDEWREAFHGWMTDPGLEGSVLLSIVFDFRRVMGPLDAEPPLNALLRSVPGYPQFTRHLSRRALDDKPPTGFFRDLVVEAKGEHAGRFDIKHGGITIIGNLARAYAIGAGLTERRTLARLRAAKAAGAIDEETRAGLEEAFRFLWGVRLEHHVGRIRAGDEPDDFIDPKELGSVTRRGLKEAFKIIARAQRVMASELGVAAR
jgi:CBS domain-containing protein